MCRSVDAIMSINKTLIIAVNTSVTVSSTFAVGAHIVDLSSTSNTCFPR